MFHSEEYIVDKNDRWMIQKYLHLQFGGATAIEEKFAPRHDAAFGDRPILRDGSNYVLEPFFIASIQRRALQMCIQGNLDSFIVICKFYCYLQSNRTFQIIQSRYGSGFKTQHQFT